MQTYSSEVGLMRDSNLVIYKEALKKKKESINISGNIMGVPVTMARL